MKKSIKMIAASLAAVTAMTFASAGASAYKIKIIDGVRYKYSDDGKTQIGKYSGWTTMKSGAKFYYKDGVMLKNSWLKVAGKRTYYFGPDGKMVTGEFTNGTKIYYFAADGKLVYGIEAKGKRASQTGIRLTFSGIEIGNNDVSVWTGQEYRIECKTAYGTWVQCTPVSNGNAWTDIGQPLCNAGTLVQRTEDVDWEWLYGKLPAGEYRLCKDYMVQLSPKAAAIKKTVYVPFSVNIYNNAGDAWGIKMSIDDLTTDSMTLNISQRTDNIGYVSYGNEYTIEKQDSNGKWTDVNKAARNNIVFREDYCEFRNDESAKNKAAEDITYYENISFYTGELPVGHYRIKRTFSGNCNGRKGTLNSYAEFDITADTPNSWGLTFGCENDASETGITLYAGVTDPTTAKIFGDIWTGEDYDIERLDNNGEWETLEPVTEDGELYWNSVGIIIPENDTRKISVNWTNTYGKLPKGTYRISKTFMSYANASLEPPAVSRTMYCTFTIDAGGVNIGDYTIDASVTKASVNSLTLAITRSGKYAGTVFWDHGYDIYKKNSSGKFKLFKSTSAINGSTNNTVDLTKNTTVKTTLSVTDVYPELTAGTYRIKLKITDQTGHIKYAAADFVID